MLNTTGISCNLIYGMLQFSLKLRSNDPTSHQTFHPTFNQAFTGAPTSSNDPKFHLTSQPTFSEGVSFVKTLAVSAF